MPANSRIVAVWFPVSERGTAVERTGGSVSMSSLRSRMKRGSALVAQFTKNSTPAHTAAVQGFQGNFNTKP